MKTLIHNGIEVLSQSGEASFVETLINKSVAFIELPILISKSVRVLQYTVGDETKFAIEDFGGDCSLIFITKTVPTDGWNELYYDCLGQLNGNEPAKMKSRLKTVINSIHNEISQQKNKTIDSQNVSNEEKFIKSLCGYTFDDYSVDDWKRMALGLWHYGYFQNNIDYFATDLDTNLLIEIKKYL